MTLLNALRTIVRIESHPLRQAVFEDIASRSPLIRFVIGVHGVLRVLGISYLLVGLYGLAYYLRARLPSATSRWIAIGSLANEIKQLDTLDKLMGEDKPERVVWSFAQIGNWCALAHALMHPRDVLRVIRLLRHLERDLRFMPACRAAAMLFMYLRFRQWFAGHKVRAVVVTSDYSPDAAAFSSAAGALGIYRIYLPHALPPMQIRGRTLLDYECFVLDSKAMQDRFASLWRVTGRVLFRGVRGENRPMQVERLSAVQPRIGIFLSGLTNMKVLENTIKGLGHLNPSILVRGHPVAFANPDFTQLAQAYPHVRISKGTTLLEDAQACDLVIACNTSAFLEILKFGIPAAYLAALDDIYYDYNGFVGDGLVPEIASVDTLDLATLKTFFSGQWPERMAYFDATFGRDAQQMHQEIRSALREVIV